MKRNMFDDKNEKKSRTCYIRKKDLTFNIIT